jgi:alpha-L-fucosidase 2
MNYQKRVHLFENIGQIAKCSSLLPFLAFLLIILGSTNNPVQSQGMWYSEPASEWLNALPVGNGRMGAMVFGNPANERIQLNEDSLWPGSPEWASLNRGNPDDLNAIRKLLREGDHQAADSLLVNKFSNLTITLSHQTLGDLFIRHKNHDSIRNYRRSLSLDSAMVKTSFDIGDGQFTQRVFNSNPDQVLVVDLQSDASEGINSEIQLTRPEDEGHSTVIVTSFENGLTMDGMVTQMGGMFQSEPYPVDHGVSFQVQLKALTDDGRITSENGVLQLENVSRATLYLIVNTSFYHEDYKSVNRSQWESLAGKTFDDVLKSHLQDYQALYNRVELNTGGEELQSMPTDERIQRVRDGGTDTDLDALLFQFGRYLLISSSRPGNNPANLQGLWNDQIAAMWNADYHLNVNLPMNYWAAEVTNLSETHEPLFDFIDRLVENGKTTAHSQYGMRGSVAHHATDLWAPAWMRAPQAYWGAWIHGGGWLAQHLWTRYEYTLDEVFLRERVYPVLYELALFYSDWLEEDPNGSSLISYPSTSPENSFLTPEGQPAASTMGTAMSHQIIAEVFDNLLQSAEILDIDNYRIQRIAEQRGRLQSGIVIGPDGRLLEWGQPYEEPEPGHRHLSHLYAFHPSDQITTEQTPELVEAVKKSIAFRNEHGATGIGWSRAWMINFFARLNDTEMVQEHITKFIELSVADNLFSLIFSHRPPFQMEGNMGFTAGIAEALLQSHQGFVELLPALPADWQDGHVKGLRTRGGFEVDIWWENGGLLKSRVTSLNGEKSMFRYKQQEIELNLAKGESQFIFH